MFIDFRERDRQTDRETERDINVIEKLRLAASSMHRDRG